MIINQEAGPRKYQPITRDNIKKASIWSRLGPELRESILVVSAVLPFRTNNYVVEELIDWDRVPNDPMYQLTFPQRGMLSEFEYGRMEPLVLGNAPREEVQAAANEIRYTLSPHPAGQLTHNRPVLDGQRLDGMQHKYRETVLFFPSQGQTCHAYCSFCFRWAQFVGIGDLQFASREVDTLVRYLKVHHEVSDVLFTGGDPMVMRSSNLAAYIEPLLTPELSHIRNIRIGTKAVAYWPQRFVSDPDAGDVLRLFEKVGASGRQLAVMGHYNHPVEFSTPVAREAIQRIRSTGAQIRMQSPMIRHVNDNADCWAEMWRTGVQLGLIPYYVFVERDTGAHHYFEIPLARVWDIYRKAYRQVSGLARSVRGPSMSAFPGKVKILGVMKVQGEKRFVLEYIQARNPKMVRTPFFAQYDPLATWFDELRPATADDAPFFNAWTYESDEELFSVIA